MVGRDLRCLRLKRLARLEHPLRRMCHARLDWSPELAQVTGIAWGWPSATSTILCTWVEHVRTFITIALDMMRQRGELLST